MRNNFVKQIMKEMEKNQNIFFLTGDLGFNALEPVAKKFPERFLNVGAAEGSMMGIAAGLALEGRKVIAYSIASFSSMRPYEQIRTDICYHNLDVKIIGTGGGFNYPTHGVTHHTVEDLAIMSVLPNMKVFNPGYSWEADESTHAMILDKGPAYIRLGKKPDQNYNKDNWRFEIGKGYEIKEGKDLVIFVTGNIIDYAVEAALIVEKLSGIKVGIVSMPTIKPIDKKTIIKKSVNAKHIFSIEEHSIIGGLGAQIGSILSENNIDVKFKMFGIEDKFIKSVGDRSFLCEEAGLSPKIISKKILNIIKQKSA